MARRPLSPGPAAAALRRRLAGALVEPGDSSYDAARRVWNGRLDRRPAMIAYCAGSADVVAAIEVAREHGLPLAVRGGGHSVAASPSATGASWSTSRG